MILFTFEAQNFLLMNKNLFLVFGAAALLAACTSPNSDTTDATAEEKLYFYGDSITPEGAINSSEFLAQIRQTDTLHTKLAGTIESSCQKKGCWMIMNMENGEELRVRFKDYGFFVPTEDLSGKNVIVEGKAFTDTISVAHLKHLAEDAGKSESEIAAIDQPEISVNFEASGVIIKE